ncbi:ribonuclease VapC [Bacteroidia bacterium]|nr:ribonuclease VapC [Bacteroidia bacterium]
MNGIDFLIDTNVVIYVLEGLPAVKGIMRCSAAVSVVSEMELLGKQNISEQEETAIRDLLNDCEILKFNDEIKNTTITIKKQFNMKLPDAIIAATAKYYGLMFITADKDFKKLDGYINVVILNTDKT